MSAFCGALKGTPGWSFEKTPGAFPARFGVAGGEGVLTGGTFLGTARGGGAFLPIGGVAPTAICDFDASAGTLSPLSGGGGFLVEAGNCSLPSGDNGIEPAHRLF